MAGKNIIDRRGYRLGIGIILINDSNQVFWAKRIKGKDSWQFPQGGLEGWETAKDAMYRELGEELGLQEKDVEFLAVTRRWLYYDLPKQFQRLKSKPLCIGQKQKWFLLRLLSDDSAISLEQDQTPEFVEWCWVDSDYPVADEVVYFKQEVYQLALDEFAQYLN